MNSAKLQQRLRDICLGFPKAREAISFGHLTFRVGKKTFAVYEQYGRAYCLTFKTHPLHQTVLIQDPRYFVAPYVGRHGWTCLRVGSWDWNEVTLLLRESYKLIAPKRFVTLMESKQTSA